MPAKRKTDQQRIPALAVSESEDLHPNYEPESDHIDPSSVVVDVELARIPRSDLAKSIAALAKGDEAVPKIKKARAGAGAVFEVNPWDLYLKPGWNLRNFAKPDRLKSIASLALSISKIGVRETLIAHFDDNKIIVHSGWNRLLATFHAINELGSEIRGVPVRFGRHGEGEADRMLSQIVNNDHSDLTTYEQGAVIKCLIGFGWPITEIALKLGRSETNVKGLLDLQELPFEILKLIDNGTVSAYFANKAYREAGGNEDRALRTLRSAIARSAAMGARRVLPMHAEGAVRKSRASGGSRSGGGQQITVTTAPDQTPDPDTNPPTEADKPAANDSPSVTIPKLIEILQAAKIEKVPGGRNYFLTEEQHEIVAVLARLPDDDER